jgi:hypothetical protein
MLSMYCMNSMLPCGRYYYDPEGGYVGNPWVKFSFQYAYLYMAWFIHHLDVVEHYGFQFSQSFKRRSLTLYSGALKRTSKKFYKPNFNKFTRKTSTIRFTDRSYDFRV